MDINVKGPLGETARNIMLKAGYSEHYDPKMQKSSFSLRLGTGRFPRFHCYVKESADNINFSLHIDQKEASYAGSHMHSGEYDGKLVEDEIGRIKRWALASGGGRANTGSSGGHAKIAHDGASSPSLPSSPPKIKKRSWIQRWFGSHQSE